MQKTKKILLKVVNKTQNKIFCLAITKLLYTYMKFAINCSDFFLVSLQKIVI